MPPSSKSDSSPPDVDSGNARLSEESGDDSSSYRGSSDSSDSSSDDDDNEDEEDEDDEDSDENDDGNGIAPLADSSDEEGSRAARRRSKKGRPAGPASEATELDAPHPKAPRFNWSRGDGLRAQKYLATRYYEWEKASREDRIVILKQAAEHIISEWSFPKHNAGDVWQAAITWLRNQRAALQRGEIREPGGPRIKATAQAAAPGPQGVLERVVGHLTKKIKGRATSAAQLWARAHPQEVQRKMHGSSIGERQKVIKKLFNKLSEAERGEWKEKAKVAYTEDQNNPNRCFENQQGFKALLAQLLSQFVGFGPDGVGAVIIDLRVGLREEDGSVSQISLTVGLPPGHAAYNDYEGGADVNEQGRWERFLASALPPNPARRDPQLVYAEDGTPSLPTPDKSWTQEAMASTLDAYYRAIWADGQRGVMFAAAIDWEAIARDPHAYLTSEWHEQGIQEPGTLSWDRIPVVYGNLLKAQAAGAPFRFVHAAKAVPKPTSAETEPPVDSVPSAVTVLGASGVVEVDPAAAVPSQPQTPSARSRRVVYKTPDRSRSDASQDQAPESSVALQSGPETGARTTLARTDEETDRTQMAGGPGGLVSPGGETSGSGVAGEPHVGPRDSRNAGQEGPGLQQEEHDAVLRNARRQEESDGLNANGRTEGVAQGMQGFEAALPSQAVPSSRDEESVDERNGGTVDGAVQLRTASVVGLAFPPQSPKSLPSQAMPPSRHEEIVNDRNSEIVDGGQIPTEAKGTAADESISIGPELGMSKSKTVRPRKRARESAGGDVVEAPATKRITRGSLRTAQEGGPAAADTHAEPGTGSSVKHGRKSIGDGLAIRVTRSISTGKGKRKAR
ncbi:hypothetical protein OH77DRAFT_738241 [Trametes cingulata]|nr:hypothetical protein OH77DRAFT_738241 [Trametes cingulata]